MDKGFLSAAGLTKGGEVETDRDRDTQRDRNRGEKKQRHREVGKGGNIPRAKDLVVSWPL